MKKIRLNIRQLAAASGSCFFLLLLGSLPQACSSDKNDGNGSDPRLYTRTYEASSAIFPNPERGFYKHMQADDSDAGNLNEATLKGFRGNNISLILRIYYLRSFHEQPLTDEVLAGMDKDMETVRRAGLKALLRFTYSESPKGASLELIRRQLDQLAPFFRKNKDVIAALQAGFIGCYGEWAETSVTELKTSAGQRAVIAKELEVLPPDRCIQLRTPRFKRNYIGFDSAIREEEAFTGEPIARIGHHNDCFLASPNDYGTYGDVAADKKYLSKEGLYVPVGGETCPPSGIDPADCTRAQQEMRRLHWSYLNEDYYRGVNNLWVAEGCMDHILREMGYRFLLTEGSFSQKHAPGSTLTARLKIKNAGYAPPYNPRKVVLILRSEDKTRKYAAALPDDPRRWKPLDIAEIRVETALPADLPPGKYRLYLFLPDPEPSLYDRPEYAVRLGNEDCWEETTGYNDLGVDIVVESGTDLPVSTAGIRFQAC